VRTFVPIVAGMANMEYKKFITYNVVGGFLWGAGMTLAGYFLGQIIPDVDKYLLPIILVIIFLSVLPGIIHMRFELVGLGKKSKYTRRLALVLEKWLGDQPLP